MEKIFYQKRFNYFVAKFAAGVVDTGGALSFQPSPLTKKL
jgi:hypothetical protein